MTSSLVTTSKLLQSLSGILITKDSEPPGQIIGAGLQSKQELLAITIHTVLILAGFRFIGTGEEDTIASPSVEQQTELPIHWNTESKDSWTFRYVRPDTQNRFLVKCITLFDNLLVTGTTLETSKVTTLELSVNDFIHKEVVYPIKTSPIPDAKDGGFDSLFSSERQLQRLISECMNELAVIEMDVVNEQEANTTSTSSLRDDSTRQPPPPSYDELDRQGQFDHRMANISNPYNVGNADLDPLIASPMVGEPGGLRLPGRSSGGLYGNIGSSSNYGGGMHVGPEHPIFRPGGDTLPDISRESGIFGGPQPLPRGSVPSGARFDPIGPFGPNPSGPPRPGRGGGQGQRGSGRGGGEFGPFSGDPDNDELPPPSGCNDMFM